VETESADKAVPREIAALLSGGRLILRETKRAVLLLFNLLAEFQRVAGLPGCRAPASIRMQVLTCGAILGRSGRRLVVHQSQTWGGLKSRIPLLDSILACEIPTSPKLTTALRT
jgi:hypothetical protein